MNRLFLMRHGEAEGFAVSDSERALTARGVAEVQTIAAWLAGQCGEISVVYHSPYLRARQTAAELVRYFPAPTLIEMNHLVPNGRVQDVIGALETDAGASCLCITHQPLIGDLRNVLVEGNPGAGYPFSTASIAALEYQQLAPGCAKMAWIQYPSEITGPNTPLP